MATAGPPPSTIVPSVAPSRRRARHLAMVVVLAVLALVSTSCLLHAPTDPGPLRFRDEVFTAVTKTANVAYGQAVSQAGQNVTLRFDLYEPTGSARAKSHGNFAPRDLLGGGDDFLHRESTSGSQVQSHRLSFTQFFHRSNMGVGQILHMNVIAHIGPIGRWIVGAEDG